MLNIKCPKCNSKINFFRLYYFLFLSLKKSFICQKCQSNILDKEKIKFLSVELFLLFINGVILGLSEPFVGAELSIVIVFISIVLFSLSYTYYVYRKHLLPPSYFFKNK